MNWSESTTLRMTSARESVEEKQSDQNRILSEYMGKGNDMVVVFPPWKSTV